MTNPPLQIPAGLLHGLAGNVSGGGGVGAGIIGGGIRICAEHGHILHIAFHAFRRQLGQNGVASRAHIRCPDEQLIAAVLPQFHRGGANVNIGDAGALHGHCHTRRPDFAAAHLPHRVFLLPVKHLSAMLHAAVQRTGIGGFMIIGRHHHALPHHIPVPDHRGVHAQFLRQFVHCGFQGKNSLGGAVSPIGPCRHGIGVNHIIAETVRFQAAGVQGNGFMSGQSHRGRPVLAVGAGIGQGIEVQSPNPAIPVRSQAHPNLHLMPGRACSLCLLPGINQLCRLSGFQGHKGGIDFTHRRLFCAETASDPGLLHPYPALGNPQGPGQNPPAVKHNLGGCDHMEPPIAVKIRIGPKGLHHGLVKGFCVKGAVYLDFAVRHHGVHIPLGLRPTGHQIPPVGAAHLTGREPVLLGMHQYRIVLCLSEIQNRLQYLIADLDQLHGLVRRLLRLRSNDGHHIPRKPHMAINDQPVVGGGFRIGLSRNGKPGLGYILPGIDSLHPGHLLCSLGVDFPHNGIGIGAAQQLHRQGLPGRDVVHVHRFSQQQLHGVLLADGLVDGLILGCESLT